MEDDRAQDDDGHYSMESDIETIPYSEDGSESDGPNDSNEPASEDEGVVDRRRRLFGPPEAQGTLDDIRPLDLPLSEESSSPGYSIVWDNVGKLVKRSQQTTETKNVYAMFANALMVQNRISFVHLEDPNFQRREATSIPLNEFIPSTDDWQMIEERMVVLTKRCLVDYIPSMHDRRDEVDWHVHHEFWEESNKKSKIVCPWSQKFTYVVFNIGSLFMTVEPRCSQS